MYKLRYLILSLVIFCSLLLSVNAEDCDSSELNYLKQLSQRITYQYDYLGMYDIDSDIQTYEVYFENLGEEFYISIDENGESVVFDEDLQKHRVHSGKRGFKVYSEKCYKTVNYIEINMPKYNKYSLSNFCLEHSELDLCGEWYQGDIQESEFNDLMNRYEEKKDINIFDFILTNYYYVIPLFVILIVLVILFIRKKIDDNKLD